MNSPGATGLGPLADELHARDPERLLTVLFAAPEHRADLIALYHFNAEVARVRQMVSEPMIGEIRLQWWREALDEIYGGGPVRAHPTVEALRDTVRSRDLPRGPFDALLDARSLDLYDEPFEDVEAYIAATSAGLMTLAAQICGGGEAGDLGQIAGRIALLAAVPRLRAQGPYPWAAITGDKDVLDGFVRTELDRAVRALSGTRLPKGGRAAYLPAALIRADAKRLLKTKGSLADPRPETPSFKLQLTLLRANLTGRV